MPKLLILPLGEAVMMAWADQGEVLQSVANSDKDKPLALQEAYLALAPHEPDEIILENGPGNFTALRVALGFARGLALGFGVPSRGIGTFEIDFQLMHNPPTHTTLYRDARGGRYYEAHFQDGTLREILLVNALQPHAYSAEGLEGTLPILYDDEARMRALAKLSITSQGQSPAVANYVRPPDAALPSEPPLVILDDRC